MAKLVGSDICIEVGGVTLVSDAHIALAPGELVALVGPNGAGKSSLLKSLTGTEAPASGSITLNDAPLSTMPSRNRARLLAYLPQQRSVAWPLNVKDVTALGRYAWGGVPGKLSGTDEHAIEKALDAVDMLSFKDRRTDTLSGGEMARVHLARCLAAETPLILADEPLVSLDPLHQWQTMQIFADYVASGGGALVVMHDLALAARFATRIVWMHQGRIVADGSPAETVTAEHLSAIYGVRARIEEGIPHIEGIL